MRITWINEETDDSLFFGAVKKAGTSKKVQSSSENIHLSKHARLVGVMKTKGNSYSCDGINLEHEPWTLEQCLIHSQHDYFIHSFIYKTYIYTYAKGEQ